MVGEMLRKINLFIAFLVIYFSFSANAYYFSNSQGSEDEPETKQEENSPVGTPQPSVDYYKQSGSGQPNVHNSENAQQNNMVVNEDTQNSDFQKSGVNNGADHSQVPANAQTTVSVPTPAVTPAQTPQSNSQQKVYEPQQPNMSQQQQQQTNSNNMNNGAMAGFGDNNNGNN